MSTEFRSEFLRTLFQRGFIHQCTDAEGLDALMARGSQVPAYAGFDCSGPSLHIGHLMSVMILRRLQQAGHKPIVLLGGATTKIGDPTFKDTARPMLSNEAIAANMASIRTKFERFLTFGDGPTDALLVNNADWMERIGYIELLRDYGRHFSINRMLTMDSVKLRIEREQEMSFLEFNYMILQAYDFAHLYREAGCRLQLGGSDQWGNIIGGVDLHRRLMAEKNAGKINVYEPVFGLTTPLVTNADGTKMGKTVAGAVWLNEDLLSSYDYWQFWRNTDDRDVGRFLRFFTDLPLEEIERLETLQGAELNEAKIRLADEATALCRGAAAARSARETAQAAFGGGAGSLPEIALPAEILAAGLPAFELFFQAGLAASKSDARRLVRGGGARVNDVAVTDENAIVTLAPGEAALKLSAGKKQHKRVVAQA